MKSEFTKISDMNLFQMIEINATQRLQKVFDGFVLLTLHGKGIDTCFIPKIDPISYPREYKIVEFKN